MSGIIKGSNLSMERLVSCLARLAGLLLTLLVAFSSQAMIVRHDKAPAEYRVSPEDYAAVFYLERMGNDRVCAATVIHPRWAITAAHCANETTLASTLENSRRFAVEVAGETRYIDTLIVHPLFDIESSTDVDLALLRFTQESLTPRPIAVNLAQEELGAMVSLLGWGYYGVGTVGRQYSDGELRRVHNRVSHVDGRLQMKFDDPRIANSKALPLEGMPSLGDSGGPAIFESQSGLILMGVAVGQLEGDDFAEESQGRYGAIAVYEKIRNHLDWIEAVIGMPPPYDS